MISSPRSSMHRLQAGREVRGVCARGRPGSAQAAHLRSPSYPVSGSHPTSCVSWDDAKAYRPGWSRRPAGPIGCPRTPSGNTRHARARPHRIVSGCWIRQPCASTPSCLMPAPNSHGATRAATAVGAMAPRRWESTKRTLGGSMTCMGTSRSGSRIAGTTTSSVPRMTVPPGLRVEIVRVACTAEAPGATKWQASGPLREIRH